MNRRASSCLPALRTIRVKEYASTRVEGVCEAPSVTKGCFFHGFDSKKELALAATDHWIGRSVVNHY